MTSESPETTDADGRITLASGRVLEPERGVIGVSHDLELFDGFDSRLEPHAPSPMTPAEVADLADVMIARWSAVKERANGR